MLMVLSCMSPGGGGANTMPLMMSGLVGMQGDGCLSKALGFNNIQYM